MKLLLFDVDGTLAKSTLQLEDNMLNRLIELKNQGYELSIVGGGTYEHIIYQIGGHKNEKLFKYIFSENGLVTYKDGKLFHENDIKKEISEELIQTIINFVLIHIATMKLPFKRGSFIRFRKGMLYITPIGGDCSKKERAEFAKYDSKHKLREIMIDILMNNFSKFGIDVKMGGQIGIGLHPKGWDKTYILNLINMKDYEEIHFFGDRCTPNGNDYPLYSHKGINGNHVKNPDHTLELLKKFKN